MSLCVAYDLLIESIIKVHRCTPVFPAGPKVQMQSGLPTEFKGSLNDVVRPPPHTHSSPTTHKHTYNLISTSLTLSYTMTTVSASSRDCITQHRALAVLNTDCQSPSDWLTFVSSIHRMVCLCVQVKVTVCQTNSLLQKRKTGSGSTIRNVVILSIIRAYIIKRAVMS